MEKTRSKQFHFRREEGSSSVRITQRGYGGKGMFGAPEFMRPSMKDQYEVLKRRAEEIDDILDIDLPAVEREKLRSELAELIRSTGSIREILAAGSRLAFEKIFVQVANSRLPKDYFLAMVQEAREVWRSAGYSELVPPQTKEMRRKTSKNAMRLANK